MPSLRQLLDLHPTILLIDSSSTVVQAAVWQQNREPVWSAKTGEAGEQIFAVVNDVLTRSGVSLDSVDAFVFCDGPGSVLGIRTAAVALRTWSMLRKRPAYAFCGLTVVAQQLALIQNKREFAIVADARRDSWHHVDVDSAGNISPLKRIPTAALSGVLFTPEGFRAWSTPPTQLQTVPYSLEALLPPLVDIDLFAPAAEPDAFLHEEPVYQTWTPQVHRAPTAS
ncbi:MAG: tRNA (adenosine(37)-N6)-threonylcarbamoyltransferase complex dimerization subunit type 1 TsaB [Nibricoccus sp.]